MNKLTKLLLASVLLFSLAFPALAEGTKNTTGTGGMTTNRGVNTNRVDDLNRDLDRNNGMFNMDGVNDRMGTRNTTNYGTNNYDNGNYRTTAANDNGTDWGWLGLLGLIGLAGLFNRNRETNR